MKDDKSLDSARRDTAVAPAEEPVTPVPIPGGDALTDPSMASFAPADAAAGASLGDLLTETFVRGTLSDEENELTREHHPRHAITGELDRAVDAPDHSKLREAPLPTRGR